MTTRRFVYQAGASHKFWTVTHAADAVSFDVAWGRVGTAGQAQTKTAADADAAAVAVARLVAEKLGKGYAEVGAPAVSAAAGPAAPAAPVPAARRLLPMLALEVDLADAGAYAADDAYVFEPKLDGHRVMLQVTGGTAVALGRNGQVSQHAPHFTTGANAADLARLGDRTLVLDGELVDGVLWIFDLPCFTGTGTGSPCFGADDTWADRHAALTILMAAWAPGPGFRLVPVAVGTEAKLQLLVDQRARRAEGVVAKRTTAAYLWGQRTAATVKLKFVTDGDFVVTGLREDGKNSATLGVYRDGVLVEVGRCSLNGKPAVAVGDVIVVRFLYTGAGDRLYQPRMIGGPRTDKAAVDCTFDQVAGARTDRTVAGA